MNSPEARSAKASATARCTKCAPAERSRKDAGVSDMENAVLRPGATLLMNSPEARSAKASATARRTKCALAECSRKAAGVSDIKQTNFLYISALYSKPVPVLK